MAEIYHLPSPQERGEELTPEQREHWLYQLEVSQRAAEYAMRQLGILPVERGVSDD